MFWTFLFPSPDSLDHNMKVTILCTYYCCAMFLLNITCVQSSSSSWYSMPATAVISRVFIFTSNTQIFSSHPWTLVRGGPNQTLVVRVRGIEVGCKSQIYIHNFQWLGWGEFYGRDACREWGRFPDDWQLTAHVMGRGYGLGWTGCFQAARTSFKRAWFVRLVAGTDASIHGVPWYTEVSRLVVFHIKKDVLGFVSHLVKHFHCDTFLTHIFLHKTHCLNCVQAIDY